jgi:hypothetical protein
LARAELESTPRHESIPLSWAAGAYDNTHTTPREQKLHVRRFVWSAVGSPECTTVLGGRRRSLVVAGGAQAIESSGLMLRRDTLSRRGWNWSEECIQGTASPSPRWCAAENIAKLRALNAPSGNKFYMWTSTFCRNKRHKFLGVQNGMKSRFQFVSSPHF